MKLATIETIAAILPHTNAERLELARVLGWQTVVKKSEFRAGDRAVFIVIDTVLPTAPWSAFLADKLAPEKPIRLKTARLRGEFSQGLLLPLATLPEALHNAPVGTEVTTALGITKYEKPIPASLGGTVQGPFPEIFTPRTDEENGLSAPGLVEATCRHDCVATLKLDGSSCTVVWRRGEGILYVASRNWSLLDDGASAFWKAVHRLDFAHVPAGIDLLVLQGELMGPGVQGNQLQLKEPALHLFSARVEGRLVGDARLREIGAAIGAAVVPQVSLAELAGDLSLPAIQRLADSLRLPDGSPAEGVVIRIDPPIAQLTGRATGFKIINRNYGE